MGGCLLCMCIYHADADANPPLPLDGPSRQFPKSGLIGTQTVQKFNSPSAPVDSVNIYLVNIRYEIPKCCRRLLSGILGREA